jgi:DNA invertase Pin-like site-specific DNA recombinase
MLAAAGAETILVERSAVPRERRRMLAKLAAGDTLILEGLDRLGTSLDDVLHCFTLLIERGVEVHVLDAGFRSGGQKSEGHREILALLGGLRSSLRSEAITAGRKAARDLGGKASGKPSMLGPEHWPDIKTRMETEKREDIAGSLGVHRRTLWAYCRRMEAQENAESQPKPTRRAAKKNDQRG